MAIDNAVVTRLDCRPFGEDIAPLTGDPNRFAGKQLDAETALPSRASGKRASRWRGAGHRGPRKRRRRGVRRGEAPRITLDARYYRQTWGRFTSVDPLHVGAACHRLVQPRQRAVEPQRPGS